MSIQISVQPNASNLKMSKGVTKFGERKVNRARQHLLLCSVYLFTIKATFLNKGELKLSVCELNF